VLQAEIVIVRWTFASDHRNLQLGSATATQDAKSGGFETPYRSYDISHERRLRFVLLARELGFSLEEIRGLLRLVDERDRPCAEARDVAAVHLADIRAKIADLKRMERVLKDVVAQCGDGTLLECPLIETLFGKAA
jgi:DNA-binding transcriptional MerR regulator